MLRACRRGPSIRPSTSRRASGFAWDVGGNGQTAVRGGFGVFHERYRQNNLNFDGLGNPPLSYTPRLFGGNVDDISPALVNSGVRFPVTAIGVSREGHPPRTYSWYAGIQRQLPWRFAIDAAYVGNRGTHFAYMRNINQLPLGYTIANPPPNNTPDAIRPYRGYTAVNMVEFGAESEYHGLQARLTRRFGQRFTANVGYTLSKALDHVDTDTTAIGYYLDLEREWGPSGLDRRHQVTIDYVYELPDAGTKWFEQRVRPRRCSTAGSCRASAVSGAASRSPSRRTATPGRLAAAFGPITSAATSIQPNSTRLQWFNPLAFGRPADGTLGIDPERVSPGPGDQPVGHLALQEHPRRRPRQRPVPARDVQHVQPRAVQRHQHRDHRAQRRAGGHGGDPRERRSGHRATARRGRSGGVQVLLLSPSGSRN